MVLCAALVRARFVSVVREIGPAVLRHQILNVGLRVPLLALPVIVVTVLSAAANANFYISWQLANAAFVLPGSLALMLYAVGADNRQALAERLSFTLRLSLALSVVAGLLLSICSQLILSIFGSQYAVNGTTTLVLLAASGIPTTVKNHYVTVCRVTGQMRSALPLVYGGALAEMAGSYLGGKTAGLTGFSAVWVGVLCLEAILMLPALIRTLREKDSVSDPSLAYEQSASPGERIFMRVLLVSDSYPPLVGGATLFTYDIAGELASRGHDVAVITAWQAGVPQREFNRGVHVFRVRDLASRLSVFSSDATRHTPPPWVDPESVIAIRRIIKSFEPDVVHSYGWLSYACSAALGKRPIPLILAVHDYALVCPKRTLLYRDDSVCDGPGWRRCIGCATDFYGKVKGSAATIGVLGGRRSITSRAVGITYNSVYAAAQMRSNLLAHSRSTDIDEHVLLPLVTKSRVAQATISAQGDESLELPAQPYILFVGALRRIKGLPVLLSAYRRLDNAPPLVLIGARAPDTPELDVPGVRVLPPTSNAMVLRAWAGAMFGVAPSQIAEPFGIVVHEAMRAGRPVIGTRPGGHEEQIEDGVSGLLVPSGDVGALEVAMRRLIADGDLRRRMSVAARLQAQRVDAEDTVTRLEAIYADAVRRANR